MEEVIAIMLLQQLVKMDSVDKRTLCNAHRAQ